MNIPRLTHLPYCIVIPVLLSQVTEESIDSDAMKVFDRNGDGLTERSDWSAPFGDMGASGENVKGYIFE